MNDSASEGRKSQNELIEVRYQSDLEVRGQERREIAGIAVPFGVPAQIYEMARKYTESFRHGAFAKTIKEQNVRLFAQHNHLQRALPVGKATLLREDPEGLYVEFKVSKTVAGDEVLELARDGALDAFSIGFQPVPGKDNWNRERTAVERTEVRLREVSLVAFPAYEEAKVLAIREFDPDDPATAPKLSVWRKKLSSF